MRNSDPEDGLWTFAISDRGLELRPSSRVFWTAWLERKSWNHTGIGKWDGFFLPLELWHVGDVRSGE
jgi:hypothetical protein